MKTINIDVWPDYILESLNISELEVVQKLLVKCSDYYILTGGEFNAEKKAEELFGALPPDKNIEDKYVIGIFRSGNMVGIVDIIKNYPGIGEWTIGLLLIEPGERGSGLGKAVHKALTKWAVDSGAKAFRIGVVQDNIKAVKFWTGLGYKKIKEVEMCFESKKHAVDIMMLKLCG